MKDEIIERFTSYVKVDTQSNEENHKLPFYTRTAYTRQSISRGIKAIGLEEVTIDENGYVMATLPANTIRKFRQSAFLAHVDTATDFTGKNVNPQIVENYDGNDITLNEELNCYFIS